MRRQESIKEAIGCLKNGGMIVVVDDKDRENEGDLVMLAEKVTSESINFMAKEGRGLICVPLSSDIAAKLDLYPMVKSNSGLHSCNFTISVDYKKGTTTGISASDRSKTIRAIFEEKPSKDFSKPGHVFPLVSKDGGVLVRAGHTEASTDLARLASSKPVAVICEIARDDGEMARGDDLVEFAEKHNMPLISIRELIEYRRSHESLIKKATETRLPTSYGEFKMVVYESLIDGKEQVALVMGNVRGKKNVLVRVHSECLTGDLFKSKRCDCGEQLEKAMKAVAKKGTGVILYMRQEGRGIGLVNKMRAYNLQDEGYDTVQANVKLGFSEDLRDYGIGAQILADLGLTTIELLTNNPKKVIGLEGYGLSIVKRISLETKPTKQNHKYLKTKREKLGHLLRHV